MPPAAEASAPPRPALLRLRFSHYCRKAEACLVQAGVPYDALDLGLRHFPIPVGAGTVPALRVRGPGGADGPDGPADWLLSDSADVADWADAHAAPGTLPLRTDEPAVRDWTAWADAEVGPVARRQAYRCAYHDPRAFAGGRIPLAVALRLWRPLVLRVLKAYTVRRFEAHDAEAGPRIVARVADGLAANDAGGGRFLVGDHATAADHAVANLLWPLVRTGTWVGLDAEPGWDAVAAYVRANRLRGEHAMRRRRARSRDLDAWSSLEAGPAAATTAGE